MALATHGRVLRYTKSKEGAVGEGRGWGKGLEYKDTKRTGASSPNLPHASDRSSV